MKQIYLIITAFACCNLGLLAQNSPYVSKVLEYKPAPGQFINTTTWGSPAAAQPHTGGINGHVSLGAYGGYIIVGFDHSIENDPANPYGVDFTVFGNAFKGWSEPGIVSVMKDDNQNGVADDTWYELKGSDYELASTEAAYAIMYANPRDYADVPWRDIHNSTGVVEINAYHTQPYYPSAALFPTINQGYERYSGTVIAGKIDDSNPTYIQSFALDYGYADNHPKKSGDPVTQPDNPATTGITEGAGGDAMKIEWAIDANGHPVTLDKIDFIKVHTGINRNCGWLGEVSTELCGMIDVAPITTASNQALLKSQSLTENQSLQPKVTILASDFERKEQLAASYHIYDVSGRIVLEISHSELKINKLSKLERGIYLAKPETPNATSFKIIVD